ncbi:MAG: hypothetical protein PHD91_04335 [bacterium]|jgi:2-oxoglutarate dehydrogenase E2 component (dihydrolipoamide succinyltransferase)|nr:hypothetical protein [bacterium]MDD3805216.1 hypothetical protein [bacterium]MDD4152925.1 hypothetical protein [bacterium]MDD4558623.1 hypothetical protein [bacterium]
MAMEVVVPELGDEIEDATVAFWFKKEGDSVELGEELVEIETDKAAIKIEAPISGILLEILAEEGASIRIGDCIGTIGE